MYGPAMMAYLKYAAMKPRGDDKLTNTMAKPKPGFMESTSTPTNASNTNAGVEVPYASTPAYPWENPDSNI